MKKILILFALVILLSGGTTIVKPAKMEIQKESAVIQLDHIAIKMDSTSNKLNHSTSVLEKLQ
ncbi:MAG: hypothetical protein EOO20_19505 [Chryseobacterium sp.]|nr:MAG: hypothetical protein EOO20_19505 [Chryseobacterium sp.]